MKTLTTIDGKKVSVSERELIWIALDFMCCELGSIDEFNLSLEPSRESVRVSSGELRAVIREVQPKFA